ncbi:MAG: MFS transporter [Chloroflexota bacterium]
MGQAGAALSHHRPTTAKQSFLTPRMVFFLAAIALTEATTAMTSVQVPVYLRWLGAEVAQVGLFFTLSAVVPLVLLVLGGWLSDALGRLRAISLGSLSGVLAYTVFALAPNWRVALLSPAFAALAMALIRPSYRAYLADHSTPETRGRIFGSGETARNLTWIFGPPLGGLLAQNLGFRWLFAATSMAYAAAGLWILALASSDTRSKSTPMTALTFSSLRSSVLHMASVIFSGGLITWLLITDGVRDIAFKMSFDLMPVYLNDIWGLTRQQIGLMDGIFGIVLVLASYPAGWLADHTSERFCLVLGLGSVLTSRLVFVVASGFWGFAFSWSWLAVGVALMDPAIQSLISKGVPLQLRGMAYGLLATSWGLISLPSPWIGGLLWTHLGPTAPFLATVALGSLTLLPAWFKLAVPKDSEVR